MYKRQAQTPAPTQPVAPPQVQAPSPAPPSWPATAAQAPQQVAPPAFQQPVPQAGVQPTAQADSLTAQPAPPAPAEQGVRPSCPDCGGTCGGRSGGGTTANMGAVANGEARQLIFAIGTIGFDYRTEARRDSFRQQMPVEFRPATGETPEQEVQPNVYDPRQVHAYLAKNPWACDKLTWTLNMDATPIYALEAESPVGMDWTRPIITDRAATADAVRVNATAAVNDNTAQLAEIVDTLSYPPVSTVYRTLRDAIVGQILKQEDPAYVSRVSVPGVLTDRTVRLFSGQVVPVVEVKSRGLYTWNEHAFVRSVVDALRHMDSIDQAEAHLVMTIRNFLDKIYWQYRNLGQSSADRAMNFAGTNAFEVGKEIVAAMAAQDVPGRGTNKSEPDRPYALDSIRATKSPFCRPGSDCQDVVMTFFDPENDRRAKRSILFTYDVSDELPVSLAPPHHFIGGF